MLDGAWQYMGESRYESTEYPVSSNACGLRDRQKLRVWAADTDTGRTVNGKSQKCIPSSCRALAARPICRVRGSIARACMSWGCRNVDARLAPFVAMLKRAASISVDSPRLQVLGVAMRRF